MHEFTVLSGPHAGTYRAVSVDLLMAVIEAAYASA